MGDNNVGASWPSNYLNLALLLCMGSLLGPLFTWKGLQSGKCSQHILCDLLKANVDLPCFFEGLLACKAIWDLTVGLLLTLHDRSGFRTEPERLETLGWVWIINEPLPLGFQGTGNQLRSEF